MSKNLLLKSHYKFTYDEQNLKKVYGSIIFEGIDLIYFINKIFMIKVPFSKLACSSDNHHFDDTKILSYEVKIKDANTNEVYGYYQNKESDLSRLTYTLDGLYFF